MLSKAKTFLGNWLRVFGASVSKFSAVAVAGLVVLGTAYAFTTWAPGQAPLTGPTGGNVGLNFVTAATTFETGKVCMATGTGNAISCNTPSAGEPTVMKKKVFYNDGNDSGSPTAVSEWNALVRKAYDTYPNLRTNLSWYNNCTIDKDTHKPLDGIEYDKAIVPINCSIWMCEGQGLHNSVSRAEYCGVGSPGSCTRDLWRLVCMY